MSNRKLRRCAVAFLILVFAVPCGLAQKAQSTAQGQDPSQKPRNVKTELKKAYKDWLEKDVTYIITDEERKELEFYVEAADLLGIAKAAAQNLLGPR